MQLGDHSFAVFVYPFCFDRADFDALVGAADRDALAVGESSWRIWERRAFPRDDLLRHVADYLNPAPDVPTTACLWTLGHQVLTSPRGLGLRADSAHLCLRHRVGTAGSGPVDQVPGGALGFETSGIDLALFRVGMGYLMLRVRVRSQAPDDWYDFLNGFRFTDRPGQVDWLIRRRTGRDRMESFVPPLADGQGSTPAGPIQTRHLIRGLLRRLAGEGSHWWREIFVPGQMLPFHALFFSGVPESEQPLVLYRLRNFFRTGQPLVPSADDLRADHRALLHYAERMWFSLTLEGGGFVAFDSCRMTRFELAPELLSRLTWSMAVATGSGTMSLRRWISPATGSVPRGRVSARSHSSARITSLSRRARTRMTTSSRLKRTALSSCSRAGSRPRSQS
jgi:hypothetical protein